MNSRYGSQVVEYSNEDSENRTPVQEPVQNGYLEGMNYVTTHRSSMSQPAPALSQADINSGYVLPAAPARANWLSGMKGHYMTGAGKQNFTYMAALQPETKIIDGYVSELTEVCQAPASRNSMESKVAEEQAEQSRLRQKYEEEVDAHNKRIDELLRKHGFINRVDIKRGITASVAVFEYIGNDQSIKNIAKHSYVMVKVPPYTAPFAANDNGNNNNLSAAEAALQARPQKTLLQLHAEMTYRNEFNIVSQMKSICDNGSRPHVLARVFDGEEFILNCPIFYNEKKFVNELRDILEDNDHSSFSSEELSEGDDHDQFSTADNKRRRMQGLLLNSFTNLNSRMRRLIWSNEDPEKVMLPIFASVKNAMNRLHNEGFTHSDIAGRNVVVKSDNSGLLVDFGAADLLNKVKGSAVNNVKYPQTPVMHNVDALKEDHIIGVITDYVSFQKTILEAVAYYLDVDFYKIIVENLPNAPASVTIEFLLKFTDREILDNAFWNLQNAANQLIQRGDIRGARALVILTKLMPYISHDHNPKFTFAELQAANDASFAQSVKSSYTKGSGDELKQRTSDYFDDVERKQAPPQVREALPRTRSSTLEKVNFFSSRDRSNSDSAVSRSIGKKHQ